MGGWFHEAIHAILREFALDRLTPFSTYSVLTIFFFSERNFPTLSASYNKDLG